MKYLAAYALLALSGKKDVTTTDLKSLLSSVQSHASDDDINKVIEALRGKTPHQLIAEGLSRIGSGAPVAASAAKVADKKEAPKKQQPKKKVEEPKKQVEEPPKEEEDADLGDLFG